MLCNWDGKDVILSLCISCGFWCNVAMLEEAVGADMLFCLNFRDLSVPM